MPVAGPRVKLTTMNNPAPLTSGSNARRIVFRVVQVMMLAYAAREAIRFVRNRFTKP